MIVCTKVRHNLGRIKKYPINRIILDISPPFLLQILQMASRGRANKKKKEASVQAIASNTREANTDDERALLKSADKNDVQTMDLLLQKGVCADVYGV